MRKKLIMFKHQESPEKKRKAHENGDFGEAREKRQEEKARKHE